VSGSASDADSQEGEAEDSDDHKHTSQLSRRQLIAEALTQKLSAWQLAELADMAEGAKVPTWLQELEEMLLEEEEDEDDDDDARDGHVRLDMHGEDEYEEEFEEEDGAQLRHSRPGLVLRQPLA
jgi:hypothetical protein